MDFSPALLPEIDVVDVVNLRGIRPNSVNEFMRNAVDAPHIKIEDDLAQQFASLWRQLQSGEQSRCHIPPFGLRFYFDGELQLQASICWECDNIFGDAKGKNFWFAFDAQHQTSQTLLSLCKQVFESR